MTHHHHVINHINLADHVPTVVSHDDDIANIGHHHRSWHHHHSDDGSTLDHKHYASPNHTHHIVHQDAWLNDNGAAHIYRSANHEHPLD